MGVVRGSITEATGLKLYYVNSVRGKVEPKRPYSTLLTIFPGANLITPCIGLFNTVVI